MKRFIWAAAIMLVVGSVLPAAADFYVIGAGGNVGTKITSVPYTISSPGLYCLAKNLAYSPTTGNAITIEADNVTLDLMGFTLSGPGKTSGNNKGIYVGVNSDSVEIRNGCVTGFGNRGIYAYGEEIRLIGLRVRDNGSLGADLLGYYDQVLGCSFLNNGSAGVQTGINCLVKGNLAAGNGGSGITANSGSSLLDNACSDNGGYGLGAGSGCTVKGNTCQGNTEAGIYTADHCLIINNASQGITVGTGCTAVNNCKY